MFIKTVTLKNWCQHEDVTVELGAGLNGIIGSNGRGKSNFLDAIRFLLTGESNNPGKKEDNLRWGAKTGWVEGVIRFGDTDYYLKRWITSAKAEMSWEDNTGGEQKLTKAAEIQSTLNALTGSTAKVLLDAVLVPQGAINAVLFQRPGDRLKEFQRVFGLQGVADAHRYLGEEAARYTLTPGLSQSLKDAAERLTAAKSEVVVSQEACAAGKAAIEALLPAEDVLRRADAAQRHGAALAQATARHQAALRAQASAKSEALAATAALESHVVQGLPEKADGLRKRRAQIEVALSQVTQRQNAANAVAAYQATLATIPEVTAEEGQAAEIAAATANAELATAENAARGNRAQIPAEIEANAAKEAATHALKEAKARNVLTDADLVAMSAEINRRTADIQGFETGFCPTCKQEVKGGPAHIASIRSSIAELTIQREKRRNELEFTRGQEINRCLGVLQEAQAKVHEITVQAAAFFSEHLKAATAKANAASADLTAKRNAVYQRQQAITAIQANQRLLESLGGVATPEPGEIETIDRDLAQIRAALDAHVVLQRTKDTAGVKLASADNEVASAESAVIALGQQLDAPSPQEVDAAVVATRRLAEIRKTQAQAEATHAANLAAVTMRQGEADRLADTARREARDQAWVETVTKVRDILHPTNLPAVAMREYAAIINNQLGWYLDKWNAPFRLWINENMEFRALKPDADGAEAEMDAARLSGGEQIVGSSSFRVAMSDTFARNAGLIVLDEPSSYLDKTNIHNLQTVLLELKKVSAASHRQVIVVTHEASLMGFFDQTVTIGENAALAS